MEFARSMYLICSVCTEGTVPGRVPTFLGKALWTLWCELQECGLAKLFVKAGEIVCTFWTVPGQHLNSYRYIF